MGFLFDSLHFGKKKANIIEDDEGKQIGDYEDYIPLQERITAELKKDYETETTWNPDTRTIGKVFPKICIAEVSEEEESEASKMMDSLMQKVTRNMVEFHNKNGRFPEIGIEPKEFYVMDDLVDGDLSKEEDKEMKSLSQWENILIWMSWYPQKFWKNSDFMKEPYFIGYEAPNRVCDIVRLGYVEKGEKEGNFQTYRITKEGIKQVDEIFKNNHS